MVRDYEAPAVIMAEVFNHDLLNRLLLMTVVARYAMRSKCSHVPARPLQPRPRSAPISGLSLSNPKTEKLRAALVHNAKGRRTISAVFPRDTVDAACRALTRGGRYTHLTSN